MNQILYLHSDENKKKNYKKVAGNKIGNSTVDSSRGTIVLS